MGKFTEYVKGAVKALNPFSHSFGINNNLCISEEDFSRILTRVLFKRLLIDVFTKLGYTSEKQQRWIEKNFFIFNQDGCRLRNIIWYLADAIATAFASPLATAIPTLSINFCSSSISPILVSVEVFSSILRS